MDDQRFDAITRLAANLPDRRNMLKLAGAAAVAGTAGFLVHAEDAEAKAVAVTIRNWLNDQSIQVLATAKTGRGARKVAAQICAAVKQINTILDEGDFLICLYPGQ